MSNNEQMLEIYEAVSQLTDRMLAAARAAEWDLLVELESECAVHVARLAAAGQAPLPSDGRARKVEIIHKILADDRHIRDLVTPWMTELAQRLNSTPASRKPSATYAGA